jgi:hypothetical protein
MQVPSIDCKTASLSQLKKAFYMHQPISGIEQRVSHYGPHNDELLPMFLISETPEGKRLFPGIEESGIGHITPTKLRKHNLLGEDGFFKAMTMGYLLFGVGGGPFDEHSDRENRESCVNLVVKHLDLFRSPYNRKVYGSLVMYVNFEDQNGDNIIQILNKVNPDHRLIPAETDVLRLLTTGEAAQNLKKGFESVATSEEYSNVAMGAFQFFRNQVNQAKLFVDGEKDFEKAEKKFVDLTIDGKKMILLEICSDHPIIHKIAHQRWPSTKKEGLAVLFIHRSNGQFALMPNRSIGTDKMVEVVKIIRQKINFSKNFAPIKFKDLGAEEIIDAVPEIHFAKATGIISNGSKVDSDVPGLIGKKLSVEDIIDAIIIGLEEKVFPKKFSNGCLKGECVKGACPFYNFSLFRCHNIRSGASNMEVINKTNEQKVA